MARYDSYSLRISRSTYQDAPQVSARLEHLQGGEQVYCTSSESLLAYVRALLETDPSAQGISNAPSTREKE